MNALKQNWILLIFLGLLVLVSGLVLYDPDRAGKSLPSLPDREPVATQKNERTLLLDRPVGELPTVTDFGWNRWAGESTVGAVLTWWLATTLLGWLAWPLTFSLFSGLRDPIIYTKMSERTSDERRTHPHTAGRPYARPGL